MIVRNKPQIHSEAVPRLSAEIQQKSYKQD